MSAGTQTVEIGGEYWSAQLETFDSLESGEYDLTALRTGYGGGKTILGSDWILGVATRIPNSHSLVLAPDKQKGGPATYKGFFERLPGENTVPDDADGTPENSPIVAGFNATKYRLTLVNGSLIQLGGADIWSRFAGTEFNAIFCDEVAHYGTTDLYDLHEMLVSRQRTDRGPNTTLWTSTGNGFDQFFQITEKQVDPNDEPLPWADRMNVIVASSLDNPYLNEKAKMRAQFEDTQREEQALHGGFSAAIGLVYDRFNRNLHIRSHDDLLDRVTDQRIYGYDAGWDDPRVVLELGLTDYGQWAALDSFHRSDSHPEDVIDPKDGTGWLADKRRGTIYAEHEPEHISKFRDAGWPVVKANKSLDEGIPHVRSRLDTDGDGDEGRPGLLVSENCTALIREFLDYQEEDVGGSDVADHELDALRYALFTHESDDDDLTRTTRRGASTGTANRERGGSSVTRRTR